MFRKKIFRKKNFGKNNFRGSLHDVVIDQKSSKTKKKKKPILCLFKLKTMPMLHSYTTNINTECIDAYFIYLGLYKYLPNLIYFELVAIFFLNYNTKMYTTKRLSHYIFPVSNKIIFINKVLTVV